MPINDSNKQIGHYIVNFSNLYRYPICTCGFANIFVYNSSVHIPDSFKLVEEFHGQFKIGGEKKGVLLDWRENEKEEEGSEYENCPEFGVLGGVIFKLDIL